MEQTIIYEYLGVHSDPIFENISSLKQGQTTVIGNINVMLNSFGLYEIETDDLHDRFKSISSCYKRICELSGDYKVLMGEQ